MPLLTVHHTNNPFYTTGKRTIFVTNNSTKSRADYRKKLVDMGIPCTAVRVPSPLPTPPTTHSPPPPQDEIFSSSYSAAIYISRILTLPDPSKPKIFVLGESGIEQELRSESLSFIGGTDPSLRRDMTPADYGAIASGAALDPTVGVVLCGLDFHINYLKLSLAYHYLARGAVFLATNTDSTLPAAGSLFPGAGSTTSVALSAMFGGQRKALALGKPSPKMMDAVEGKFRFDRNRACMVGDRLDTDVRFGNESGLGATLAVLTGVAKRGDWEAEGVQSSMVPAAWVEKLADLRAGME